MAVESIIQENAVEALQYTPDVARKTEHIYQRLSRIIPEIEWPVHAPYIAAIQDLKAQRHATILVHNYQTPEIFHGIADIVGDSLALAHEAAKTDAEVIVVCGVHFMAETAKLLNPEKTVLIPDLKAGCSLSSSITAEDVRILRQRYPDTPVVTYVNTSAAVKAESDICCTSSNALDVVRSLGARRVILLPDEFLGRYVASQTGIEIILWRGHCQVHARFTADEIRSYRNQYKGIEVLAHPECPPDVLAEANFVGSTTGMIRYIDQKRPPRIVMITECSMSDNVAVEFPQIEFVRPCNLCPHMKRITLPKILQSLQDTKHTISIEPSIAGKARMAVQRMLDLSSKSSR
jgi:quinolinate synthase